VAPTLCANVTTSTTWSVDTTLSCQVFVLDGATLTIEAGVTVYSFLDDGFGRATALIVAVGAKLVAVGTADLPITFTTAATVSDNLADTRGLWGGIILLGRAPVYGGTREVEGIRGFTYGGSDDEDSSGSLEYVRVWHGGNVVSPGVEINGITLAGVGAGTTVEHCEVAFNLDDGFEMFGGTVNLKWVSVLFVGDDGIDADEGYAGKIQFAYVMTGAEGHHAFEADGKGDAQPRSYPQIYSATFVGNVRGVAVAAQSADDEVRGLVRLREGTGGEFGNLILANVNVDAAGVVHETCASERLSQDAMPPVEFAPDLLWFSSNNIVSGPGRSFELGAGCDGPTVLTERDPTLRVMPTDADWNSPVVDPTVFAFLDAANTIPSAAFTGVDDVPAEDTFFTAVTYKGAFGSNEVSWLEPWSWLAASGRLADASDAGRTSSSSSDNDSGVSESTLWIIIVVLLLVFLVAVFFGYQSYGYKNKYEKLFHNQEDQVEIPVSKAPRPSDVELVGGGAAHNGHGHASQNGYQNGYRPSYDGELKEP